MQSEPEVSVLHYYFHDLQNTFYMKTAKFNAQAHRCGTVLRTEHQTSILAFPLLGFFFGKLTLGP
jgi:hypothetical protein